MRQLSLLTFTPTDDYAHLAGLLSAIRGAMRRAAGRMRAKGVRRWWTASTVLLPTAAFA